MNPLYLAILLYFVAILLTAIDVFVPSGGVLLLLSIIAGVGAVLFGFKAGTDAGLVMTVVVLATVPVLLYLAVKLWPHTPFGRRILLEPPQPPSDDQQDSLRPLIGQVVLVRWPIAPTGQLQFGHRRISAMSSDGQVIDVGQRVKVVGVHELMLVVAQTRDPLTAIEGRADKEARPEASEPDWLNLPANQLGLESLDESGPDRKS